MRFRLSVLLGFLGAVLLLPHRSTVEAGEWNPHAFTKEETLGVTTQ